MPVLDRKTRRGPGYRLGIIPAGVFFAVFGLFPFIYSIYLSCLSYSLAVPERSGQYIRGSNYAYALWHDPTAGRSALFTVEYACSAVIIEVTLGILVALFLQTTPPRSPVLVILMLPMLMPPLVTGLAWKFLLQSDFGIVPFLLRKIGLLSGTAILGSEAGAILSTILVDVWQWTPFVIVIIYVAARTQPARVAELAQLDGLGRFQILRHITLPYLRSLIVSVTLLRFVDCLRDFEKTYVLTGGGPGTATELFTMYQWRTMFKDWEVGYGATLATLSYVFSFAVGYIIFRLLRRWREHPGWAQ